MPNAPGLLFFVFGLLIASTLDATDNRIVDPEAQPKDLWRVPEREGANALYFWMRLNEVRCKYYEVVQSMREFSRPLSFVHLRDAAKLHGLNAVIRKGHTDDLIQSKNPVIVYLDGIDGEHGFFAVALLVNDRDEVLLNKSSTALLITMSGDEFRRVWTGHYLTIEPSNSYLPWLICCFFVLSGLIAKHFWLNRQGVYV